MNNFTNWDKDKEKQGKIDFLEDMLKDVSVDFENKLIEPDEPMGDEKFQELARKVRLQR